MDDDLPLRLVDPCRLRIDGEPPHDPLQVSDMLSEVCTVLWPRWIHRSRAKCVSVLLWRLERCEEICVQGLEGRDVSSRGGAEGSCEVRHCEVVEIKDSFSLQLVGFEGEAKAGRRGYLGSGGVVCCDNT